MKSILSKYLGHLAGYVGSAVGIVAAIDPTLLPSVGKLTVASAALLVGVAHHSYTAGTLAGAVTAAQNALAKVPAAAAVAVLALVVGAGFTGCASGPQPLTTSQLKVVSTQVCAVLNGDLALLQSPAGAALLTPSASAKVTTIIAPDVKAVCAAGAIINAANLTTLNDTVVPALISVVQSVPSIPDQPEILAALSIAQVALVPLVDQVIAAAAAASSAPASSSPGN